VEEKKYDKKLDVTLYEDETRFQNQKIKVKISSYDGQTPELQINREIFDDYKNYYKWTKLGRMNLEESKSVIEMLKKSLDNFDKKEE